ncbi:MAG TPA: DUF5615 family PIN-like protein [Saprospiraceae bacterium]|nr:DUF5615 family PIN-like protein [Saprospiraceae bacterium]HMP26007.1 DUF5615 family PIN-like protein [Saprospiraceae bacterium]
MKFIVDAQLPYRLAKFIRDRGLDAIHTDDLPEKDRTADSEIRRIAREQNRIVITKDNDFLESHILKNEPAHLFLITTGNITNKALLMRFEKNWTEIEEKLARYYFLEMDNTKLIIHS